MSSISSFHGNIAEIPYISADNFTNLHRKAYFLSHCHTDHTEGLYLVNFLEHLRNNSDVFVYMSEPSAVIVEYESNNNGIMEFVRPLKLGTTIIHIQPDPADLIEEQYLKVTLIPAGHCIGSTMFLYETKYKTVLYTGDFRISTNSLQKYSIFHLNKDIIKIDVLYVDTTFQYEHKEFPKRSDSVACLLKEMGVWLDKGGLIALHCSAKYGYEFVFKEIYEKLGSKVYVGDKYRLYSQFPELRHSVTDRQMETKIHVCRNRNEHFKSHENCLQENQDGDFLYIHFSAYKWTEYKLDDYMLCKNKNRIDVCFPTHCSQTELNYFIKYFSAPKVVGFRDDWAGNFDSDSDSSSRKRKDTKEVVRKVRKVDGKLLREIFD